MRQSDPNRRDVIVTAALSLVGVGALAAAWPLVASWRPADDAKPPGRATVDLTGIAPGETRRVPWRGRPVLVRHRPIAEREHARATPPRRDHLARSALAAELAEASDDNRTFPGFRQWLVVVGDCTYDACLVRDDPSPVREVEGVAFHCPCCATRYDLSGRLASGPGRTNLAVPRFVIRGTLLTIG